MASLGTLTLNLVANIGGFVQNMGTATRAAQNSSQQMSSSFRSANDAALDFAKRGLAAIGVALGGREILQYAEQYTVLQNRLRLVTGTAQELASATDDVFRIALGTAQSVDSVAQVYQRFAQNADSLGLSLQDVAELTDTVAKAVAISGSSAASASAALMQFGQALASSVLRGEELNSVMEQTPGLAQAIARGLGVSVGSLRALAAEGKITAAEVIRSLRNAAESVDELFGTRVLTPSAAMENFSTALTKSLGELDQVLGATSTLAGWIDGIAQSIAAWDFSSVAREFDAVMAVVDLLGKAFNTLFQFLGTGSFEVANVFDTSFANSFQATARGLDNLAKGFTEFFGGLNGILSAIAANIEAAFTNAFRVALDKANELVNGLIQAYNRVADALFLPMADQVNFGSNGQRAQTYSLSDSWEAGSKSWSRSFGLEEAFTNAFGNRQMFRAIAEWEAEYTGAQGRTSVVTETETKKKVSAGDRLIDSLAKQVAEFGSFATEYEKLQWQVDAGLIKFDSPFQQNEAFGYAAALDLMKGAEENYKEQQEALRDMSKLSKNTFDDMGEFAKEAARSIQQSLGDGLYDILSGNFDSIGTAFLQTVLRMSTAAASANLSKLLFGNFDQTGQFGGLLGNSIRGLLGGGLPTSVSSSFTMGQAISPTLTNLAYFADGGYTGAGGKFDPKGIVHAGEFVINADAVSKIGLPYLERLNRGYATGGYVGNAPALSSAVQVGAGGVNVEVNVASNGQVSTQAPEEYKGLGQMVGEMVRNEVRAMNARAWRQGGDNWQVANRRG